MANLVHEFKRTITLGVLDGASVSFVERVDGTERVKVTVDIGSRKPAYSSAAGKALLAGLRRRRNYQALEGSKLRSPLNPQPKSLKEILTLIAKVRDSGFAVNNEDSTPDLIAVAVPIKSGAGEHIAALGAAFPAGYLRNKESQKTVTLKLQRAADEISSLRVRTLQRDFKRGGLTSLTICFKGTDEMKPTDSIRLTTFLLFFFVVVFLSVAVQTPAQERIRIGISSSSPGFLPTVVAEQKGFFTKYGLASEHIRISLSVAMNALSTGDLDYAITMARASREQ